MSYPDILAKVEEVAHSGGEHDARMSALSALYVEVGEATDLTVGERVDLEHRISTYGSDLLRRRERVPA